MNYHDISIVHGIINKPTYKWWGTILQQDAPIHLQVQDVQVTGLTAQLLAEGLRGCFGEITELFGRKKISVGIEAGT